MAHQFMKNTMAVQWDRHTGYALLLVLCLGIFTALWGLRLPALTAAAALYLILLTLFKKGTSGHRAKKDRLFLDGIKGTMVMEKLLLLPTPDAQQQAAHLYFGSNALHASPKHDHLILDFQGKPVLVHYAPIHPDDPLTGAHAARIQRLMLKEGVQEGYILCPGTVTPQAKRQSALQPSVTLLFGQSLRIRMGAHAPIRDADAIQYAKRMYTGIRGPILSPDLWTDENALKLMRYAFLLEALMLFTSRRGYGFSALLLMMVSAIVHTLANKKRPHKRGR